MNRDCINLLHSWLLWLRCTRPCKMIEQFTDCVEAPALIKNPSSMFTHDPTPNRYQRTLSASCRPRFSVPRRYRKGLFEAMISDCASFARELARRFVANAMSGLRGARNCFLPTLRLKTHLPRSLLQRRCRPVCTYRSVFGQHVFHILSLFAIPRWNHSGESTLHPNKTENCHRAEERFCC